MALVVLIGGLVASAVAAAVWRDVLRDDASARFSGAARTVRDDVDVRLDDLAAVGRGLRVELDGLDGAPSQQRFASAVADVVGPRVDGDVASVVYVQPAAGTAQLDALRAEVQAQGRPSFEVNNPIGAGEHLVATYEVASGRALVFDGLDLATVPSTQAALDAARAEGRAVLSAPFEMLPRAAATAYPELRRSGVAVAVPVYEGSIPATSAARLEGLRAWVLVVTSAEDVLAGAVEPFGGELAAQLVAAADLDADPDGSTGATLLASTALDGDGSPLSITADDPLTSDRSIVDGLGQRWELTVADVGGLGAATSREPIWILAGGTTLSVLLAALVWSLANTRASALAMAEAATVEVRRTEARFRALVHNLPELIVVTDDERTISFVSPSVEDLLGWTADDAVGAELRDVVHPEDRARFEEAMTTGRGSSTEVRVRARDGRYRWYQGSVTDLSDDPAVEGLVLTAHDVTAQKAIEDRLAHQATHDPLTRLPNRVIVNDRLGHALARGRRDGSRAAAIFLDIDEFKRINDTWGHAAGDELLREVAHRVQRAARAADTVGRYGGDEFVVICEDLPSVADALLVAERIRDEVARPAQVQGTEVRVGTSIGVALSGEAEESTRELLGRADAAMYEAKSTGRGRIVVDTEITPAHDG